jgi:hypothetical protein
LLKLPVLDCPFAGRIRVALQAFGDRRYDDRIAPGNFVGFGRERSRQRKREDRRAQI